MESKKLTVNSVKNFETEVDYTTVLDNFEGPLDLLLYLINKEEIEIKDIFVSQVTEQFLSYMKGLPYLDMDKASEYLNIASTIINIKSRSLVPVLEDGFEDYTPDDFEDPKETLIRAIEEYNGNIRRFCLCDYGFCRIVRACVHDIYYKHLRALCDSGVYLLCLSGLVTVCIVIVIIKPALLEHLIHIRAHAGNIGVTVRIIKYGNVLRASAARNKSGCGAG